MMLLTTLLTLAPSAHALSCLEGPDTALPMDGATDVPTNVLPRVGLHFSGLDNYDLELVNADTDEVLSAQVELVDNPGSTDMGLLTPDAELAPLTTYVLRAHAIEWEDNWELSTFTTGEGPTSEAPAAPTLQAVGRDRGTDEWGSWDQLNIEVQIPQPASFLVEVASDSSFSDARAVQVTAWLQDDLAELWVGDGLCGGVMELASDDRWVRVASVAYDGQVSEFAEATEPATGCSSAPTGSSALGVLVGMLALLGARRRAG